MDYKVKAVLVDSAGFARTITRLAHEIIERNRGTERLAFVGMQTRGVYLAQRLARKVEEIEGTALPVGVLDTTMYRDDFRTALKQPQVRVTEIPFDLYNMNVVLVDDVLYTGRTVRAALDALIEHGRPALVQLAVLVDRGHRELPIRADYVGKSIPTSRRERVRVHLSDTDGEEAVLIERLAEES